MVVQDWVRVRGGLDGELFRVWSVEISASEGGRNSRYRKREREKTSTVLYYGKVGGERSYEAQEVKTNDNNLEKTGMLPIAEVFEDNATQWETFVHWVPSFPPPPKTKEKSRETKG